MFVTFDTNVPGLSELVAKNTNIPAYRWCTSDCVCETRTNRDNSEPTIAYDTQISLCPTPDMPSFVDNHFIYLDFSLKNPSFMRIMTNVRRLGSRCTVIADSPNRSPDATYALSTTNVRASMIASSIASVITSFVHAGRLQHPYDIATGKPGLTRLTRNMIIDVLGKYSRRRRRIARDCTGNAC